jgi:polysaccharide export outer membrane protein
MCTLCLGFAGPQDENKKSQSETGPSEPGKTLSPGARDSLGRQLVEAGKVEAVISKMIAEYDLKPHPLPSIPDDPPPHEGAMIGLPNVVEPPDLVIVEVLEALPARPISGERMVRPDGKISLGFYGDVDARGLTMEQLKVAIIKHMRRYLDDETLGLKLEPNARGSFMVPVQGQDQAAEEKKQLRQRPRRNSLQPATDEPDHWAVIPPAESDAVFVDVTAYNSHNFYVEGDAQTIGKFPWTGNETVLDAIEHAGGLVASADPKNIRLVRPGRNGKPSRIYKVDLEAIREKGDATLNYQMFPGDRLVIGRNAVVSQTTEIDRLVAPLQTVTNWNLQYAFMLRALQLAGGDSRDELLKELVEFWSKELVRGGNGKIDEQELRNALIRKLKVTPAPIAPNGR